MLPTEPRLAPLELASPPNASDRGALQRSEAGGAHALRTRPAPIPARALSRSVKARLLSAMSRQKHEKTAHPCSFLPETTGYQRGGHLELTNPEIPRAAAAESSLLFTPPGAESGEEPTRKNVPTATTAGKNALVAPSGRVVIKVCAYRAGALAMGAVLV